MSKNFKQDLKTGQGFERAVGAHFKALGKKVEYHNSHEYDIAVMPDYMFIECKFDLTSKSTGNIAVEYESRGKPSAIATTTADVWFYYFWDGEWKTAYITTDELKQSCLLFGRPMTGGDNNTSKFYLLDPKDVRFAYIKLISIDKETERDS